MKTLTVAPRLSSRAHALAMPAAVLSLLASLLASLLLFSAVTVHAADAGLRVGVYYYPGWRDDTPGSVAAKPWQALHAYPAREPLLGYYRDGEPAIMARQLEWMADYGIDYVVFDWYWNHRLGALKTHAIDAFLGLPQPSRVQASLLWANHTEFPAAAAEFDAMVRHWLAYFAHPRYLTIDGMPVVFVFSIQLLEEKAQRFGSSAGALLARARAIAQAAGFRGIYFIGGASANSPVAKSHITNAKAFAASGHGPGGFDALSAYNYHGPATFRYAGGHHESHSYAELDRGYRDHWQWMMAHATLPYVVPMTSGWDRRPWGGSRDGRHDQSRSTPAEFASHLAAARATMLKHPQSTLRMGVICCWNEFGEGAFIEPTRLEKFAYLERVRQVFGVASTRASPLDDGVVK